jgi:Na+-translocating ferredoxin:NAD+ oxidoreductase RnfD subunit
MNPKFKMVRSAILFLAICIIASPVTAIDCQDGYYDNGGICAVCESTCATCQNGNECVTCDEFILNPTTGL